MTTSTEQPAQDHDQSCPNCEALTKQVTALKTCLEVERGFREQEQPAQQPVSVTDELVDTYCNAWEQSFTEDNPYHKVRMTTEDRKHIVAGLEAALAQAPTEQEQPAQQEPIAWVYKPHMELLWPDEIEVKDPSKHTGYKPVYTSPPNVPMARASKPLTDEQEYEAIGTAGNDLLELAKRWADNEVHVYQFDNEARKIIKAVLHRAHGIKRDA